MSIATKPRSNSDITPGTSPGGTQTKKKRVLKKSNPPAVTAASPPDINRRISHSYCEAVVYNPDTDETTVTSVNTGNMIKVKGPRARSVSMFEVVRELVPGIGGDEEVGEGEDGAEGPESISDTHEDGDDEGVHRLDTGAESDQEEHTLTGAIQLMGANCPYKDLLLQ